MAVDNGYPLEKYVEYGALFAFTEMLSAKSVLLNLKINEKYSQERMKEERRAFNYSVQIP